jgi:trimethylamine--corrinoid protein Co-methyltransferase
MLVALSDPDILVGPGLLGGATILSLEQIIFDVEVSRIARRALEGVPVSDEGWLDDAADRVGPCGSFLGEQSTRRGAHNGEWRLSDFGVSGSWDAWRAAGSPSSLDYARERVAEILATHRSEPLPDDVADALESLQKRARAAT